LSPTPTAEARKPAGSSRYVPWAELLRRTFASDSNRAKRCNPLGLIALPKTDAVIEKLLVAMHLRRLATPREAAHGGANWGAEGFSEVQ
jgi:hypothetical protein